MSYFSFGHLILFVWSKCHVKNEVANTKTVQNMSTIKTKYLGTIKKIEFEMTDDDRSRIDGEKLFHAVGMATEEAVDPTSTWNVVWSTSG